MSAGASRRSSLRRHSRSGSADLFSWDASSAPAIPPEFATTPATASEIRDRRRESIQDTVSSLDTLKAKQEARRHQSVTLASSDHGPQEALSSNRHRSLSMQMVSQTRAALQQQQRQQVLDRVTESEDEVNSSLSPRSSVSPKRSSRFRDLAAAAIAQHDHQTTATLPNLTNFVVARKRASLSLEPQPNQQTSSLISLSAPGPAAASAPNLSRQPSLQMRTQAPSIRRKSSSASAADNAPPLPLPTDPIKHSSLQSTASADDRTAYNLALDRSRLDNDFIRHRAEIDLMRSRLDEQERRCAEREHQCSDLEASLQKRSSDLSQLKADLDAQQRAFSDRNGSVVKYSEQLQHELTRKRDALDMEKTSLQSAKEDLLRREREHNASKDSLETMAVELERKRKLLDVDGENVLRKSNELTTLRKSLSSREAEVSATERRCSIQQQRLDEHEHELLEREQQVSRTKTELDRERVQLQSESKAVAVEKSAIQNDVKVSLEARQQVAALSQEMESQLAALQHRETCLTEKESEVDTLLLRLKQREADLAALGKRLELERSECEKRKQVVSEREQELNHRERTVLDAERRLQDDQSQQLILIERRQTQLDNEAEELSRRSAAVAVRESNASRTEQENRAMEKQLSKARSSLDLAARRLEDEKRLFEESMILAQKEVDKKQHELQTQIEAQGIWQGQKRDEEDHLQRDGQRLESLKIELEGRESRCVKQESLLQENEKMLRTRLENVADLEAKRAELFAMLSSVKERKERLQALEEELTASRTKLGEQATNFERERRAFDQRQEQLTVREQQIQSREEQIRCAENNVHSRRLSIEKQKREAEHRLTDFETQRKQAERDRAALDSRAASLKKAEKEVGEQLASAQKELERGRQISLQSQVDANRIEDERERLQRERNELSDRRSELSAQFGSLERDQKKLQERESVLAQKQAMVQKQASKGLFFLEQRNSELDTRESTLQERADRVAREADDVRQRVRALDQTQSILTERLAELAAKEEEMQRRRAAVDEEATETDKRMKRLENHERRLQSDTQAQLELLGQRLEDCRQQRVALDSDREKLEEKYRNESVKLLQAQTKVTDEAKSLKEEAARLSRAQASFDHDRKTLERQMKLVQQQEEDAQAMQSKLHRQEREVEKRVVDLNLSLKQAAAQASHFRSEQNDAEAALKELRETMRETQMAHASLQSDFANFQTRIVDAGHELRELESQKKRLDLMLERENRECAEAREAASQAQVDRVRALSDVAQERALVQQLQCSINAREMKLKERESDLAEREVQLRASEEAEFAAVQAKMKDLQKVFNGRDLSTPSRSALSLHLRSRQTQSPASGSVHHPVPIQINDVNSGAESIGLRAYSPVRGRAQVPSATRIRSEAPTQTVASARLCAAIQHYSALTGRVYHDLKHLFESVSSDSLWSKTRMPPMLERVRGIIRSVETQCSSEDLAAVKSAFVGLELDLEGTIRDNALLFQQLQSQGEEGDRDILADAINDACRQLSVQSKWSQSLHDDVISPLSLSQQRLDSVNEQSSYSPLKQCATQPAPESNYSVDDFELFRQQVRNDPAFFSADSGRGSSPSRDLPKR